MKGDWHKTVQPVMTAYKLVTIEFKWMGLQNKVEKYIMETGKTGILLLIKVYRYVLINQVFAVFAPFRLIFFREETFHQLPPAALLHDRQVD